MSKIAILLGNGIFDSGIKNYKDYVDEFIEFANKNKVDKVIISGGHTNPKEKLSEATSIKKYAAPLLDKRIEVITEDNSITAAQCIKSIKPLLKLQKSDDVSVFCDSVISVKVMWFIMHYWFGLSREQIERDALNYISLYYSKGHNVESLGKGITTTGVLYENVDVHPCSIKPSMESAIAQQLVSLVDVSALYSDGLSEEFINMTKARYGINK